jgi:hypothetical protein
MASPLSSSLHEVLRHPQVWRGDGRAGAIATVPTGDAGLDAELPGGGWPAGALTEILGDLDGIGELGLLLPALARLTTAGKRVVWLAPPYLPYPPALAAAGVELSQLALVRAPGRRDALWAAEQALRAGSCHALLAWVRNAHYQELRRLAVAAEASHAVVALFRPGAAALSSSPASLRLALEPARTGLSVRILKRRGAPLAVPLAVSLKRPAHALGRDSFPRPAAGIARAARRLGVPVHS